MKTTPASEETFARRSTGNALRHQYASMTSAVEIMPIPPCTPDAEDAQAKLPDAVEL